MIIKLLSSQIKNYWEIIKFSAVKADDVKEEHIAAYTLELLFDLLNDKAACLISFDKEKKELQRILIVSFFQDEIKNEKVMWFRTLYSFTHGTVKDWETESIKIYEFAVHEGCKSIQMQTKNQSVIELATRYGFKEDTRNYKIKLSS